jgi:YD repeat-containing protein
VTNALCHVSTTIYDAAGRAAAALDPLSFRTTLAYDAANRPVAQTDPLGHRTTSVYDAAGIRASPACAAGKMLGETPAARRIPIGSLIR